MIPSLLSSLKCPTASRLIGVLRANNGFIRLLRPLKFDLRGYTSNSTELNSHLMTACSAEGSNVGLILGTYTDPNDPYGKAMELTPTAEKYNKYLDNKIKNLLLIAGPLPLLNEVKLFYGLESRFPSVAVVGLGEKCLGYNEREQIDLNKERIRQAVASAARTLQELSKVEVIFTESFGHAESAAEGLAMAVWSHQDHKKFEKRMSLPKIFLFDDCDFTGWQIGLHKAAAQNLARQLCDAPPNLLTPRKFAEHSVKLLNSAGINIEMKIKSWLKMVGMDCLLALARGSCEDPVLVEAAYYGCDPDICPIVLIGKGVTFDSGGVCLKKKRNMLYMRNDMAGAATVVAVLRAASALQLPINIRALMPMCENMLGPRAMKPGDTVRSLKGQSIRIFGTDLDGRLGLADVLTYAASYKPRFILDIGTLSKGSKEVLGRAGSIVFTNNDALWEQMRIASIHTGDRVWRFPLWKHYSRRIKKSQTSDLRDFDAKLGGPCLSAAFLKQFLCGGDWIHVDNYGVTRTNGHTLPYIREGMSGRPTRTIIEFLAQFACKPPEKHKKPKIKKSKAPKQMRPQCKAVKDAECRTIPN